LCYLKNIRNVVGGARKEIFLIMFIFWIGN